MTTIQNAIEESASTDTIVRITVTAEQRAELMVRCEDCHVERWGRVGATEGPFIDAWGTDDGREWRIYATIA
jgi:hypothetical protein